MGNLATTSTKGVGAYEVAEMDAEQRRRWGLGFRVYAVGLQGGAEEGGGVRLLLFKEVGEVDAEQRHRWG